MLHGYKLIIQLDTSLSNNWKINWNQMLNIDHSTNITVTQVAFASSFSSKVYALTLSNPPTAHHYGQASNITKTGFELWTSRPSGATALQFDYYSIVIGT